MVASVRPSASPARRGAVAAAAFAWLVVAPAAVAGDIHAGGPAGVPARPADWVEGILRLQEPAEVRGGVELGEDWRALWADGATERPEAFDHFSMVGSRLRAVYRERLVLPDLHESQQPPYIANSVGHKADVFADFRLDVAPATGPQRLLVSATDGATLSAADPGEWRLSTTGPQEAGLRAPSPRRAQYAPQAAVTRWHVLLEGERADVDTTAARSVTFYGFNVTVAGRDGEKTYRTGLWQERVEPAAALGVGHPTLTKESVLVLEPSDAHLVVASTDRPVRVVAPSVALEGRFLLPDARGHLAAPHGQRTFGGRTEEIEGRFVFAAPDPGPPGQRDARHVLAVQGQAPGLRLDPLGASAAATGAWKPVAFGAAGFAAAAILYVAAKALLAFFTRLQKDDLLEDGRRRWIDDTVRARPGIPLPELLDLSGFSRSSLRHHLRVLRAHGRIRAFKLQGVWRLLVAGHDLQRVRDAAALEADPALARVAAYLAEAPECSGQALLARLRAEAGLTESGGRKALRRAVRLGFAAAERRGRELVFRATAAPAARPVTAPAPIAVAAA